MERSAIGPYRIVRRLGAGGMGAVYLVEREGRTYALKVVLPGVADVETWARFQREARVLRELEHPGIVRWIEAGEAEGTPYVVMEALDGGTLGEQLRRYGPLPIEQALGVGIRLAEALEYAHSRGVIHRDLKPSNVLLGQDGPRLSDFGLAALHASPDRLTQTGDVLGSPNYMAPEQAEGRRRKQGVHTDVYGLGAVLYHALTGQPPFDHPQILELLRQVSQVDPAPPSRLRPDLPPGLERLLLDCLAKDPAARPASAGEVGRALAQLRGGDRQPVPRARTGPVVAVVLGVVGVALVASLWAGAGADAPGQSATPVDGGSTADGASTGDGDADAADDAVALAALEVELRELLNRQRVAEAEALARAGLADHPDSAMLHRALAVSAARQQRLVEALAAATRATELGPDEPETWAARASVEAAAGRATDALASAERALELDDRFAAAWTHKGMAEIQLGQLARADASFTRALELGIDGEPYLRTNRATVRAQLGRFADALEDLDVAIAELPGDRESALLRAQCLSRVGRRAEAIEQLRGLLADGPQRQGASLLVELLLGVPQPDVAATADARAEAREVAAAALAADDRDARLWRLAGLAADDPAEVERCLSEAIRRDPTLGDAWRERGMIRAHTGRLEVALADLDRAVPLLPDDPVVYFNRALVRRNVGRLEDALADLRAVIARDPSQADAYLHAAQISLRLNRPAEALVFVDDGLKRGPANPAARELRAQIVAALEAE